MRSRCICTLIVWFALVGQAAAWDRTGHLVVAHIAWQQMSPEARAVAAELLDSAPPDADLRQLRPVDGRPLAERQAEHFQIAAYWPDIMRDGSFPERRDKYHRGDWHWVNIFFETRPEGGVELTDREPRGKILDQLAALSESVGDVARSSSLRAIDLAWILHLVGDLHQPLHATARITPTEPEGDRGANLFPLAGNVNLHWYWDSALRSANFRWWFQSETSYIRRIADSIQEEHPRRAFGDRATDRDFTGWARESFEIARTRLYPPELQRYRKPGREYTEMTEEISRERIALAGYRLGRLLDSKLK